MAETISAIYEDGMFKPLQKVDIPNHKHVHLMLVPDEEATSNKCPEERIIKDNWHRKQW